MKRFAVLALGLSLAAPAYAQMKDMVTVKHDPIKSLNWPTMTMAFSVKDKAMLDKVAKDKKVRFEFVQQGQQFVITERFWVFTADTSCRN